jgi:hypothetical protein
MKQNLETICKGFRKRGGTTTQLVKTARIYVDMRVPMCIRRIERKSILVRNVKVT